MTPVADFKSLAAGLHKATASANVIIPETPCSPDRVKPKEDLTPNKPMNNHNNKWDIVYLMNSNQKFLNRNRLFPGQRSLILKCEDIESVRRVLSKPRFEHPEALGMDHYFFYLGGYHFWDLQTNFFLKSNAFQTIFFITFCNENNFFTTIF